MLNKSYQSCIVGLNYISLLKGIVELKNGNSALIIDNEKYSFANQWFLNIGALEKSLLSEIGESFEIETLKKLDTFLKSENSLFKFNDIGIELSKDYFSNIKELARKFPNALDDLFIMELEQLDPAIINTEFSNIIAKISKESLSCKSSEEIIKLFNTDQNYTGSLFYNFSNFLNSGTDIAKQLHFVLQMSFQNILSNQTMNVESKYLLISLLGERFKVDKDSLHDSLIYEFRKLGGDIKKTSISDWGITEDKINHILLDSIDGLIKIESCYYYGQLSLQNNFELRQSMTRFSSIGIDYHFDHPYIEFFSDKRVICNHASKMGSDFPYWEFTISPLGHFRGIYCYTDQIGTKANFYFEHARVDFFETLSKIFPGISREHWFANAVLERGLDSWHEFSDLDKKDLVPKNKKIDQTHYYFKNKKIQNLYFKGPERGQIMGFYGYLVDLFSEV